MSAAPNLLENTPLERNILREEISGKGSRREVVRKAGREGTSRSGQSHQRLLGNQRK